MSSSKNCHRGEREWNEQTKKKTTIESLRGREVYALHARFALLYVLTIEMSDCCE